ncbi:bcl-2-like protein 10 [Pteronotus mesoamericanus]|uniref:bcl-2-like protein 10 n=1 Tax=Pteronotus mesoamericanus TaxID=1884717 RepID=UPI0023EB6A5B|nr:bcl-2-like protein 10 [Pteronotus parnellii mesoamericanus]
MEDELRLRTVQLLADYLESCARMPGTAARRPSTPEAAVLRSVAARVRQRYHHFWSHYRGYRGNRLGLVANLAQRVVRGRGIPSWGHVVALVSFAGILLETPPARHAWELKTWEADVGRDCQKLVALLCDWLTVENRTWLEAHGGWDGFCHIFTPTLICPWSTPLVRVLLSCFTATILTYLWTKPL